MSKAKFISHPDFYDLTPINVYHREILEDGVYFPTGDAEGSISNKHPKNLQNKHIIFRKSE